MQQWWSQVDGRQQAYLEDGKLVVTRATPGGATPGGWPNISYAYLDSLPSDPARLKAVIEANLKAQNYVVGGGNIGIFNATWALMDKHIRRGQVLRNQHGFLTQRGRRSLVA